MGILRVVVVVCIVGMMMMGCIYAAIESPEIKLTHPVTYTDDGKVYIERDLNDEMLLKDDSISSAVRLGTLVSAGGVSVHGDLTGLGADDHSQYYNNSRIYNKFGSSESGSGATYINSLPISGAVGGTTDIGDFVGDQSIHYKRAGRSAEVAKVNGQFSTIQSAIDWIVSTYGTSGGVVKINPGEYTEQITMAQNVSLRGEPGVIIKYGVIGNYCLTVPGTATDCELRGITLQSTNVTGKCQAILIVSGGDLILRDCIIDYDSSVGNEYAIYSSGELLAYDTSIVCWDIGLYSSTYFRWNGGSVENKATSGGTGPIFIDDGGIAILRDFIVDANGADSGIFGSTSAQIDLYDVTIKDATIDLDGVFGTTYNVAGTRYASVGQYVTVNEVTEGRAQNLRHYVQKTDGDIDDAYRYRMDSIARFRVDYEGNIYAAGDLQAANFSGGGSGVYSVAKSGGDYQTIQGAIDDITTGVILIYPGIYEENVIISKSDISLRGVDFAGVIDEERVDNKVVIKTSETEILRTFEIKSGSTTSLSGISISNLTIFNDAPFGVRIACEIGYADPAAAQHSVEFDGVSFYGGQDTITITRSDKVVFRNCYIEGFIDDVTIKDDCEFYECDFYCYRTDNLAGNLYVGDSSAAGGVEAVFVNCSFDSASTSSIIGVGRWGSGSYADIVRFYNCTIKDNIADKSWYSEGGSDKIYLSNTNGVNWGVDAVQVEQEGLLVEGDVVTSGSVWRYYAAAAGGYSPVNVIYQTDYLVLSADADTLLYPIDYMPGSKIIAVAVKYKGNGAGDGVKINIVYRDDSGTASTWTDQFAQQTSTSTSVTRFEYDCADFVMLDNYIYCIKVEAEVPSASTYLYAVGFEIDNRYY